MIVAELIVTEGGFGDRGFTHKVVFDVLENALGEYSRVAALMKDEAERTNDKPTMVEIEGSGQKVSLPLRNIRSVGLTDYAHANQQAAGVKDTFPNIFKV